MKIIGILGRAYYNKDNQEIIQTHNTVHKYFINNKDVVCITILPTEKDDYLNLNEGYKNVNIEKMDYILDKCDAFVLPGGTYCYENDEYVINYAIKHNKPLLAICLGFQTLCSVFAKDRDSFFVLKEDKDSYHLGKADEYKHKVFIQKDTKLEKIINKSEIQVNSVHHSIVDYEMNELIVNAISDDDIIEGVEYPNKRFIMGFQWHPEYLCDENSNLILDEFINSIR